jgi:hypothetical protein
MSIMVKKRSQFSMNDDYARQPRSQSMIMFHTQPEAEGRHNKTFASGGFEGLRFPVCVSNGTDLIQCVL